MRPVDALPGLFDHLSALFEQGHARDISGLMTDEQFADEGTMAEAAVLILVCDRPKPSVILTKRPTTMRDHPGQVAFPGGKLDPGEDAIAAALREAEEELAIPPDAVRVIGPSDRYFTGTGFAITPVVGVAERKLAIQPNPREVEAWFEAPLRHLLMREHWTQRSAIWKGQERRYLDMHYNGFRIWGVTAAIIANLARRIDVEQLLDDGSRDVA
ncbi:MAG: CoA pyrophosphatase [Pseudomonadota bacterium]